MHVFWGQTIYIIASKTGNYAGDNFSQNCLRYIWEQDFWENIYPCLEVLLVEPDHDLGDQRVGHLPQFCSKEFKRLHVTTATRF